MRLTLWIGIVLIALSGVPEIRAQGSPAAGDSASLKQYLYLLKPSRLASVTEGPTGEERDRISEHFNYLERLTAQGTVILVGRTQNADSSTFGIIIFEAKDDAAARAIMERDPAVRAGVMSARLFPYKVALMRKQ